MGTVATAATDVIGWDFLCLQEVAMLDDELQQMLNYGEIDEDGHCVFKNEQWPWDTAIVVSRRWAQNEWSKSTCTWATAISTSSRGRRMMVASVHLPDS